MFKINRIESPINLVRESFSNFCQMSLANFMLVKEYKISKLIDLVERLSVINEGALLCSGEPQAIICDDRVRECYWGKEDMVCY